jgi:hypothetical protein
LLCLSFLVSSSRLNRFVSAFSGEEDESKAERGPRQSQHCKICPKPQRTFSRLYESLSPGPTRFTQKLPYGRHRSSIYNTIYVRLSLSVLCSDDDRFDWLHSAPSAHQAACANVDLVNVSTLPIIIISSLWLLMLPLSHDLEIEIYSEHIARVIV